MISYQIYLKTGKPETFGAERYEESNGFRHFLIGDEVVRSVRLSEFATLGDMTTYEENLKPTQEELARYRGPRNQNEGIRRLSRAERAADPRSPASSVPRT